MKLSRLFPQQTRAESEGSISAAFLFCLLSYSFLILGQSLFSLLLVPFLGAIGEPLSLLGTAAAALPILFFVRFFEKRPIAELYIKKEGFFLQYVVGLCLGVLLAAVLFGLLLLFGAYEWGGMEKGGLLGAAVLLPVYAVQGGAEEVLCRGFCMSSLCRRFGGVVAALFSAAFFSLLHIANPAVSAIGILNIFLFGLLFASLTQRSQSLAPAAAMHAGWNFFVSLCGVQVSGNSAFGAQISLIPRIPLWTGGAFGVEGSPLLSILLLLAICVLFFVPLSSRKAQ